MKKRKEKHFFASSFAMARSFDRRRGNLVGGGDREKTATDNDERMAGWVGTMHDGKGHGLLHCIAVHILQPGHVGAEAHRHLLLARLHQLRVRVWECSWWYRIAICVWG